MARVITFSRTYPSWHPMAGEPTYFMEKIGAGLADMKLPDFSQLPPGVIYDWHEHYNAIPKYHTIRAGEHWKEGDVFSPRIWIGKPRSRGAKQIAIGADIEIVQAIPVRCRHDAGLYLAECPAAPSEAYRVAMNDGFPSLDALTDWLLGRKKQEFEGQLIGWRKLYDL